MPIPDQARVETLLAPHHQTLVGVVNRAWARWLANPERAVLYRRARAVLVHNYAMLEAMPGLPGIKTIEKPAHETAFFLVADELVFRFKKGDQKGLSSNIGTQAALDYNDPNECLSLFVFPNLIRVDVVYALNELETKISDVLVVARDNERVAWSFSILARDAAVVEPPKQLGTDLHQPPAADTGMRVPEADDTEGDAIDGQR